MIRISGAESANPDSDLEGGLVSVDVPDLHREDNFAAEVRRASNRPPLDPDDERIRSVALSGDVERSLGVMELGPRELAGVVAGRDASPPRHAALEAKPLGEPEPGPLQRLLAGLGPEAQPRVLGVGLLELHRRARLAAASATLDRRLGIGGLARSVVAGELGVEDRRARVAEIHRGPDQSPGSAVESQLEVGDRMSGRPSNALPAPVGSRTNNPRSCRTKGPWRSTPSLGSGAPAAGSTITTGPDSTPARNVEVAVAWPMIEADGQAAASAWN